MNLETLPNLLARAIGEQDLSHTAAARRLGVTRQTLYGWLRGQTPSHPEHIDAIVGFSGEDKLTVLLVTGWLTEDDIATVAAAPDSANPGSLSFLGLPDDFGSSVWTPARVGRVATPIPA